MAKLHSRRRWKAKTGIGKHGPVFESGSETIRHNNNKKGRRKTGEVWRKEKLGDNETEQRGKNNREGLEMRQKKALTKLKVFTVVSTKYRCNEVHYSPPNGCDGSILRKRAPALLVGLVYFSRSFAHPRGWLTRTGTIS